MKKVEKLIGDAYLLLAEINNSINAGLGDSPSGEKKKAVSEVLALIKAGSTDLESAFNNVRNARCG